eukprot:m.53912 g.53912  ORF g.53912 m.53912 type:complete len:66 (+) comp48665_c0_seq1:483-680(+)
MLILPLHLRVLASKSLAGQRSHSRSIDCLKLTRMKKLAAPHIRHACNIITQSFLTATLLEPRQID